MNSRTIVSQLLALLNPAGLAAITALTGLVFAAGFQIAYRQLPPFGLLQKVDAKLTAPFTRQTRPQLANQDYPTTLLTLKSQVGRVETGLGTNPSERLYEVGGGLASFGEDVLLLAYTGQVFAARSATDIRQTQITAPDTGRAAYLELADTPGSGMNFHRGYIRYNGLAHIERGGARLLLASYTEFHADQRCATNTVASLNVPAGTVSVDAVQAGPADWTILYRTSPCLPLKTKHFALEGQMASGAMAFAPPSTLLLTSGDYHFDGMRAEGEPLAQDQTADYGKVIAIDLDTGEARHVSSGHRNMQGIAFGADSELYVTEHGPRGGDEFNRIVAGANYGWPRVSLGTTYSATPLPSTAALGRHDGYAEPVMAWVPSVAVSGMARVDGFHPAWQDDFIVTTLKDRSLYRLRMAGDRVQYAEHIPFGQRLRQVHQHTDGRLVLWTDNQELVFLTAQDLDTTAERIPDFVARLDAPASVKSGFETAIASCIECHSLAEGDHVSAPSLAKIFGDPIGATPFDNYSDALKSAGGQWDRDTLTRFLSDPQSVAPGTAMQAISTSDPRVVEAVVDYLQDLDRTF